MGKSQSGDSCTQHDGMGILGFLLNWRSGSQLQSRLAENSEVTGPELGLEKWPHFSAPWEAAVQWPGGNETLFLTELYSYTEGPEFLMNRKCFEEDFQIHGKAIPSLLGSSPLGKRPGYFSQLDELALQLE